MEQENLFTQISFFFIIIYYNFYTKILKLYIILHFIMVMAAVRM